MSNFRTAVDTGDHATALAMLADDVVLRSPVSPDPHSGRRAVEHVLRCALQVLDGFRYVGEIVAADGRDEALIFEATVGGMAATGCDFLHFDDDGRIDRFMVMIRPLPAAEALNDAMTRLLAAR